MTMVAMGTRRRFALSYYLAAALLFLLTVFPNAPLTAGQPLPWQLCGDDAGNYTEGSAYQANIRVLASVFPKNASSSPALFTKGSAGTAPDAVYALTLCRGDTNASSCAWECLRGALFVGLVQVDVTSLLEIFSMQLPLCPSSCSHQLYCVSEDKEPCTA